MENVAQATLTRLLYLATDFPKIYHHLCEAGNDVLGTNSYQDINQLVDMLFSDPFNYNDYNRDFQSVISSVNTYKEWDELEASNVWIKEFCKNEKEKLESQDLIEVLENLSTEAEGEALTVVKCVQKFLTLTSERYKDISELLKAQVNQIVAEQNTLKNIKNVEEADSSTLFNLTAIEDQNKMRQEKETK